MILWATENGVWRERWNDPSRLLVSAEEIATNSVPARLGLPAVTWRMATGSAANAAILAPGGMATDGCWLLYRDDQASQMLGLIGESLCLHSDPWSVSFSTDTQPTDRIEELRWRGVSSGSPVERTARQSVRPVLDLGNPATLPPVESAAHRAETGLEKAPPPASARVGTTSSVEKVSPQGHGTAIQTNPFATKGKGDPASGPKVSLKERMKGSDGGGMASKRKGTSVGAIISVVCSVILLLIGVLVWKACIFDFQEIGEGSQIRNTTKRIINELTKDKGKQPDDAWWNQLVEEKEYGSLGDSYRIVGPGFKHDLRKAREELSHLESLIGKPDLLKNFIDAKGANYPGLLGKIIDKIASEKEAKEAEDREAIRVADDEAKKRATAAKAASTLPPSKSTQTITLTLNGQYVTNGQVVSATNGQKFLINGSAQSDAPVAITKSTGPGDVTGNSLTINGIGTITLKLGAAENDQFSVTETNIQIIITPPESRVNKIIFWKIAENAYDNFFTQKDVESATKWSWITNCNSEDCLVFFKQLEAHQFEINKTDKPLHKDDFNKAATNTNGNFKFIKKYSDNNLIEITYAYQGNTSNITHCIPFYNISAADSNDPIKFSLDKDLTRFLNLVTNGNQAYRVRYSILSDGDKDPKYTSDTLSDLAEDKINKVFSSALVRKQDLQYQLSKLTNDNSSAGNYSSTLTAPVSPADTNVKSAEDCFINAGAKIFAGVVKNNTTNSVLSPDDQLLSFEKWKSSRISKSKKELSYREYLSELFSKINDATQQIDITKLANLCVINKANSETYSTIEKLVADIQKIDTTSFSGTASREVVSNNTVLANNLKGVFTVKNKEAFKSLPSINDGYLSPEARAKKQMIQNLKADLESAQESIRRFQDVKKCLELGSAKPKYRSCVELVDQSDASTILVFAP